MNGRAHRTDGFGNHLPFKDLVTGCYQWLGRRADVHVQRQHQLLWQRAGHNGRAVGQVFHFRRMNAAMEVMNLSSRSRRAPHA